MLQASYPPRRNTSRKRGPAGGAAYSRRLTPAAPAASSCSERRRVSSSLIVHLRGGEQKRVPFLRRARCVERGACAGRQEGFDRLEIQAVGELRKTAAAGGRA